MVNGNGTSVLIYFHYPYVVSFLEEDIIRISDHLLFIVDVIADAHQWRFISVRLSSDDLRNDTQLTSRKRAAKLSAPVAAVTKPRSMVEISIDTVIVSRMRWKHFASK